VGLLCHMHGRAGLAHVCPHIRSAIQTRAVVPNWLSYPFAKPLHDYVVLRLCSTCAEEQRLPTPPRMLREGEVDIEQLLVLLDADPMCEACFAARSSSP
jgi:hypothetical protein